MIQKSEIFLAYLTLLTGLAISGVAIYYSVAGLVSIFSAAVIPIIVMGVILEIGKLVATLWLKQFWNIAPSLIKTYLTTSVIILMFSYRLILMICLKMAGKSFSGSEHGVIRILIWSQNIKEKNLVK